MSKVTVTCEDFRAYRKNTLAGFACIKISELKLEIKDIAIHQKSGRRWAQLPAKPQIRDGALVKGDDGKVQYLPIMSFATRAVADAFSAAVITAVLDLYFEAFDEERIE